MNTDVMTLIRERYHSLTKQEKKVANYIFGNDLNAQYLSITSLAEQCGVSDATVFRFCKSLGFNGYNQFKLALAMSIVLTPAAQNENQNLIYGQVKTSDSVTDMCKKLYNSNVEALTQTLELFDESKIIAAGKLLSDAKQVYCLGQGGSLIIAMEAWGRFVGASKKFHCIEDSHLQAMTCSLLDEGDVILFFSYSGATKDMIDTLNPAKTNGAKIIIVTHFEKSPAAAFADVLLLCGSSEGPLQQGSIAAKMALLFVVDVLFNEFCRTNLVQTRMSIETTAGSIANKLL